MPSESYRNALQFAATLHQGQKRKGSGIAYLSHLISVSALVMESGGTEEEAIAALLHDAIEDRGNDYRSQFRMQPVHGREALKRDLELEFGPEVLSIVSQCTDDEYLPAGRVAEKGTPEEWRARKEAYVTRLKLKSDLGALRVSCADKLHNARAILADYEIEGEALWHRFTNKDRDQQLWYYESLAEVFGDRSVALGDPGLQRLAGQLARTVEAIRRVSDEAVRGR